MDIVLLFRNHFEPLRNAEAASWQTEYMRHLFLFLGVSSPLVRKAVREMKQAYLSQGWQREVKALWWECEREMHYAAIFWAIAHRAEATKKDWPFYEEMICSHSWWDSVDTIAPHLVGPLVEKEAALVERVEEWLHSPHLWLRRSALLYQLRWKEKTDAERLFRFCTALGEDKEFFIRKAIGWALREYSKTNPEAVARYIQTASLSPLSLREAQKYLR